MIVFQHSEKHMGFEGKQYVQVICTLFFTIQIYDFTKSITVSVICNAHLSIARVMHIYRWHSNAYFLVIL